MSDDHIVFLMEDSDIWSVLEDVAHRRSDLLP